MERLPSSCPTVSCLFDCLGVTCVSSTEGSTVFCSPHDHVRRHEQFTHRVNTKATAAPTNTAANTNSMPSATYVPLDSLCLCIICLSSRVRFFRFIRHDILLQPWSLSSVFSVVRINILSVLTPSSCTTSFCTPSW